MDHYLNSLFVLLVEPSRSQRRILLQQFEDLGISQFETYDRGEEALVRIDTEQPDLVISALFLPDMTGRELVLEMRDNPLSLDIPFILISSETSIRELDPVKQAGASAVLPKPFAAADLKRAINMIMDWENPQPVELDSALRILLVDDSKLARRMISRTLRRMGLENIVEAEDGRAALPLIQRQDFDLIITDYNMPRMDGRELLWFIRNKSRQPKVPVMMVTTEGDQGKLSAIQHQGVSAIIGKPFDAVVVKALIESMA